MNDRPCGVFGQNLLTFKLFWVLQRMGLDVDSIVLCQPDNGELALEVVNQLSLSIT